MGFLNPCGFLSDTHISVAFLRMMGDNATNTCVAVMVDINECLPRVYRACKSLLLRENWGLSAKSSMMIST